MPSTRADTSNAAASAKLLVVLLAFAWGSNWITTAIALREVPPWSLRMACSGIGTITLLTAAFAMGREIRVPRGEWRHIIVAGFFNVAAFQVFSAFAQLSGATSRTVMIVYSMPIWSAVLSRLILGERLTPIRLMALGLCVGGLAVLLWPLFAQGVPYAALYSLGCALSWAIATIYIKRVDPKIEPLANAAWQLLVGSLLITIGTFVFEGAPHLWPLQTDSLLAVLCIGIVGVGLAQFLWWSIVDRLPTITASIGTLLATVLTVIASTLILGERLTLNDIIGFGLIFVAAAGVLLQPHERRPEIAE